MVVICQKRTQMARTAFNNTFCLHALAKHWDISAASTKSDELAKTFREVAKQLRFRIHMIEDDNAAIRDIQNTIIGHLTAFASDGWIDRFCVTPTHVTLWGSNQTSDRAATLIAALPRSTQRPSEETRILLTLLEWLLECKPNASPSSHPVETLLADIRDQDHSDHAEDAEYSFGGF
jgi:hypothetical protein